MYVDKSVIESKKKGSYIRTLLRESFREEGKVKKRTIANISHCTSEEINAIQLALRHKKDLTFLGSAADSFEMKQGARFGATWLIYQVARRLGIVDVLGNAREGKLALWQVIARVMDQGSRLSAVRLAGNHGACDVLDLDNFNEEHLYSNLDWLSDNQSDIEDRFLKKRLGNQNVDLFLYDVTSSYLEGVRNEFAAFGYNRDGKKGKRQIVVGLLCDNMGYPVSVEVFKGNTKDTSTFGSQVQKVATRFGGGTVTFVGDRGMIKGPQMELLKDVDEHDFHYITAITKPQIEKLINDDKIQLGLFDYQIAEVQLTNGPRYVLRKNPIRAEEIQKSRKEKFRAILKQVDSQNQYLMEHKRAWEKVAMRKVEEKRKKLKIDKWVNIELKERKITISQDKEALAEISKLDGCYVLQTDLSSDTAEKEIVHDRYKDLASVEKAFRTSKTAHLELRPINVRLESRTQGHAFVVMMAYHIVKELASCWSSFNTTVEEGIGALDDICAMEVRLKSGGGFNKIPEPRDFSRELLEAAKVKLPEALPSKGINVVTKKKLQNRR